MKLCARLVEWLARRMHGEKRISLRDPDPWIDLYPGMFGSPSAAGERVSSASSLAFAAYFACIRAISEDEAKLPLHVYRRVDARSKERAPKHPVEALINFEPNPDMSAMSFRETITAHALGYSGGYAEIVRGADGAIPRALYPLDPTRVRKLQSDRGGIVYEVRLDDGTSVILAAEDVLDIHGLGYDALTGYVIATIGRESIGAALGAQKQAASFFGKGTLASGILETPEAMSEPALDHLRKSFAERHTGADAAHRPMILEEGLTWKQISTEPEKAQLLETRRFTVEDVCRWFRVPPHKVGHLDKATFSNIEMQSIEYVTDTLTAWFRRWELEIDRKLLRTTSSGRTFYSKHVVAGLLRGDSAARSAYYREQFMIGALSENDIRELEDLNPIGPEGDTYYVPLNMQRSEIASGLEEPEPEPEEPPGDDDTAVDDDAGDGDTDPDAAAADRAETVRGILGAHARSGLAVLERFLRVEAEKIDGRRARHSGEGFEAWLQEWYSRDDRAAYVATGLRPVFRSWAESLEALGGSPANGLLDELVSAAAGPYLEESLTETRRAGSPVGLLEDGRALEWIRDELAHVEETLS